MKRDQWIGLGIVVGSIVIALLLNVFVIQYEVGSRLELFILPAIGVIVGVLIIFTNFESVIGLSETIEELPEALSDDVETLKNGRISFPIVAIFVSIIGILVETWLIFHFRKWNAEWGSVSVLLISSVVSVVTVGICLTLDWFRFRYERLSWKIFIIPAVGFLLCAVLGSVYAEPQNYRELSLMQRDQLAQSDGYSMQSKGGQFIYMMSRSSGSGSSNIDIDCDGDECMALVLIVIVIICIAGSAIIPHFWLLASILLLTIMLMVAIRELLYYEKKRRYDW